MICDHDVMSKEARYIITILFNLDIFDKSTNHCLKYTMDPLTLFIVLRITLHSQNKIIIHTGQILMSWSYTEHRPTFNIGI